jgi:hypothetical protein
MNTIQQSILNQGMRFGLIMGFVQVAATLLLYIINKNLLVDFKILALLMVINIALMVWPVRNFKRANNNTIDFKNAFFICLLTIAGGTLVGIVFNYVLYNIIDTGLADFIKERTIEKTVGFMERMGTSQEDIEKAIAPIEEQDFRMTPAKLGGQYIQAIIFGAIPALIIAAILRTKKKPLDEIQ